MADEQDLISSYIDAAGIQRDTDLLLTNLKLVDDAFAKLAAVKVSLDGAVSITNVVNAAKEAKPALDAVTAATDKLISSQSANAVQLASLKIQQQEQAKANKQAALEALGMVDAYGKLSAQYAKSARDTQNLAIQFGAYSAQAKESAAATQVMYQRLLEADAAVGKFSRNVGNYPTVFKTFSETGKAAVEKVNDGFKEFFRTVAASVVTFIGVRGLFEFGKDSIESFERMESEGKRLENSLHNLGASVKDIDTLKGSIVELSKAFPYLTATDLTQMQQKLITYGKLTADQIKELSPTIINFAANQRISLGEATDTITKALEGNSRSLKQYGINMKDAGDVAGRFSLIQNELGGRVAGAGDIFAETGEGKIATYKARLTEVKQTIGEQLLPVYAEFLSGSIGILNVIKQIDFANVIKGIAALTAIWLTYRAVVLSVNIAQAFNIASQVAERAASEGVTIAKAAETLAEETNGKVKNANTILTYILVGAQKAYAAVVKLATTEITIFNTAIKISPVGIFITLLGAAVVLLSSFSAHAAETGNNLHKMQVEQETTNETMKRATEVFVDQKQVIEELIKKVNDHNLALADRKKALNELIALDPQYLQGLTLQNIETEKGKKLIDDYVDALHKKAIAEAAQSLSVENQKAKLTAQVQLTEEQKKYNDSIDDFQNRVNKAAANSKSGGAQGVDLSVVNQQTALKAFKDQHTKIVGELNATISDADIKQQTLEDIVKQNSSTATFKQTSGLGKGQNGPADTTADDEARKSAEDLAKYLVELDDKLAKAKRENSDAELKRISDDAKEVEDDSRNSLDKRLQALDIYSEAQAAIIANNANSEIAQEQKKLDRIAEIKKKDPNNLTDEEDKVRHTEAVVTQTIINLRQKRDDQLYALEKANAVKYDEIVKSNATKEASERVAAYSAQKSLDQAAYSDQLTALTNAYNKKFQAARGNEDKQKALTKQYNDARLVLQDQFIIESLKKDIAFAQHELEIQQANSSGTLADQEKIAADLQKLSDLKQKLSDAETKLIVDNDKKQGDADDALQKKREKNIELLAKSYSDVTGIVEKVITQITEAQKASLQTQIDGIEAKKQTDIDAVNASLASDQTKATKTAQINARAQAQEEQLQARQKQEDIKKAEFDKAVAIGQIIINTAKAVTKDLGDPLKVAYDIGLGAAELDIAISAPIPKFKSGREGGAATLGIVGDGGKKEVMYSPDLRQTVVTPDTDTLTYIPKDWGIAPSVEEFQRRAFAMTLKPLFSLPIPVDHSMQRLISEQKQSNKLLQQISKRPTTVVKNTFAGWSTSFTDGQSWQEYVNRNVRK